jgi:hypothetical protein
MPIKLSESPRRVDMDGAPIGAKPQQHTFLPRLPVGRKRSGRLGQVEDMVQRDPTLFSRSSGWKDTHSCLRMAR